MKPGTLVKILAGAGAYALGLYLFNFFPPLPSNFRPATALVPGLGLFWGGAGAIAAALGNFLFDLRDEIDLGTPLGILGNLVFAYLPFRVAQRLPGFSARPKLSTRWIIRYLYLALLGAAGCGTVIGFGLEGPRLAAFAVRGVGITLNNFITAGLLGWLPLLLAGAFERRGWVSPPQSWSDSPRKKLGFGMMMIGLLLAFTLGALTSAGLIPSLADYGVGPTLSPAAAPIMVPGMVLFLIGLILM
jgi:energy-coupling factor transport system substrate-specific component